MAKKMSHQDTAHRPPEDRADPIAPYRGRPAEGESVDRGDGYARAVPEPENDGPRERAPAARGPDKNAAARAELDQKRREKITELNDSVSNIQAAMGNTNQAQVDRRNEIADNLDKLPDRQVEGYEETEESPPVDEGEAAAAAAEGEEAAREAGATAEPIEEDEPPPSERKYKLKINGQEVELTESEVLARAQKVASADEYLQTATEALKRTQPPAPPHEDVSASVEEVDVEETLTSALMGDKEAIKTIARRLKSPTPAVDPAFVDDRVSFRSAVDWFRGEYADVVNDPMLYRLVVDEDAKLAQAKPELSYRDRLSAAGNSVRTWRDKLKGPAPASPPPNPKLVRKASVAPVPVASARQAPVADEDEEESVESVIDKMAKARHQPGAIRNGSR